MGKNNIKLHVITEGNGPTVVLVPGLLGSTRYWDAMTRQLVEDGHKVIRPDLLGFGESPKPNVRYDVETHCSAIEHVLFKQKLTKPVTLVGLSMSTILVAELARRNPGTFDKLVMYSPMIYHNAKTAKRLSYKTGNIPRVIAHGPFAWLLCHTLCKSGPIAKGIYWAISREMPKEVAFDAVKHTWYSYSRTFAHVIVNQNIADFMRTVSIETNIVYGPKDPSTDVVFLRQLAADNHNIKLISAGTQHHAVIEDLKLAMSVFST